MNTFGDRLRYARTLRKLSQAELAQACGVSQGTIGNYESGRRTRPQNIFRLAEVLEVSPAWLAMNTGPMELSSPSVFAEPPAPMVSTVWPLPGIDPARIWALSAQKREVLTQAVAGMLALLEEQS